MAARDQRVKQRMLAGQWVQAVAVVVLISCCAANARAADHHNARTQIPALIVFGDSTSDVGTNTNIVTAIKSNFPPYGRDFQNGKPTGRFTNGYMFPDFLAMKLGLPMGLPYLDPGAAGERILHGVNFASAASGFLQSTSRIFNVIPAFEQLQMFREYQVKMANLVGKGMASSIMSQALYLISTVSNDYILNYLVNPALQQQYTTAQFSSLLLSNQLEFMKQLYEAGGRNILIFGFPPIGCLPAQITIYGSVGQPSCVEDLNKLATAYNSRLLIEIPRLQSNLSGVRILYGDAYTYIYEAFNNPSKYGYTETRHGCCGKGLIATSLFCNSLSEGTCSDPSKYMFFDSLHPTEPVYKALSESTYNDIVSFFGL